MNASKLAIPALCVGLLGVVGGVAVGQVMKPVDKPTPVVNIAPAAETVEPTVTVAPSPTTTTSAPAPVKPVKVAVSSTTTTKATSATPQTVQRQAIVSDPTPTSTTSQTPAAPSLANAPKGKAAPETPAPNGYGDANGWKTPTATK